MTLTEAKALVEAAVRSVLGENAVYGVHFSQKHYAHEGRIHIQIQEPVPFADVQRIEHLMREQTPLYLVCHVETVARVG